MNITVGIPSRGRPLELAAAVLSLVRSQSGGHEVEYLIGHDAGDVETLDVIERLVLMGLPVKSSFGERPGTLGEMHNRLIDATPQDGVFMLWSDRLVSVQMNWDHGIALGVMQYPTRVLWADSHHLVGPCQFVLPPRYRNAAGRVCPALFPFWFEDSWVEEVESFVHGPARVTLGNVAAGPRTQKTNRMRDLPFWIGFFSALRPNRIEQADRIAHNLGIGEHRDREKVLAQWEERDRSFLARADDLTSQYGTDEPPDASYRAAKEGAVSMWLELNGKDIAA